MGLPARLDKNELVGAPSLSVVIPAYNERKRLPKYLETWLKILADSGESHEILVVDDGSSDGTWEYLQAMQKKHGTLRPIRNEKNSGKGFTIRRGMLEAKGAQRLFADADGATPADQLYRLREYYDTEKCPIVIGSRVPLRNVTFIERNLRRHYTGRIFATLVSVVSGLQYYDTQCGFKLFSAAATERIFPKVRCTRWAFDVEVLLIAERLGLEVAEVPINWQEIPGSKVRLFKHAPRMALDIFEARRRHGKARS